MTPTPTSTRCGLVPMHEKDAAKARLDSAQAQLLDLSRRIHATPELAYEERQASGWLAETLDAAGFSVTNGVGGLPTAFTARFGSGPLHVAICAEYDALPTIGHACGHNIIAATAVGAGLAAARVADDVGLTVSVIGTPAEEIGDSAGKVLLLERGVFDGVHAAMMVHPMPWDILEPDIIAGSLFEARYAGKAAHAAAFPDEGINAADALTVAQVAIGLLRQHIKPTDRIHGIVTKGGDAPNVVPDDAAAKYLVRSVLLDDLFPLRDRVFRCFEAGATATGATLAISGGQKPYAHMRHDHAMAAVYKGNAEAIGRRFVDPVSLGRSMPFSSDMGNISLQIPSIHPTIGINSLPAVIHQAEFAAHCISPAAESALLDGALSLAWTAIDLAADPALRSQLLQPAR